MNNIDIKKLKDLVFLNKYKSPENIKKLGNVSGFSNLLVCCVFYFWFFLFKNTESITATYLLILNIVAHLYLNFVLINWSLSYENSKWILWVWLNLIFVSPMGLPLIFVFNNPKYWEGMYEKPEKHSIFHSFTNSFINLPKVLKSAIEFLNSHYPEEFQNYLQQQKLNMEKAEDWDSKDQFKVMALAEGLRQTKKKNTFQDIDFKAHWYDHQYFDFAIKDPKSKIMPLRYRYAIGFVVLDEFNNYKKILDSKKEIKANLKFGSAKVICLYWGKGFRIFVNES